MSFTFYLALTLTNIRNQVARPTSRVSVPASQLAKQPASRQAGQNLSQLKAQPASQPANEAAGRAKEEKFFFFIFFSIFPVFCGEKVCRNKKNTRAFGQRKKKRKFFDFSRFSRGKGMQKKKVQHMRSGRERKKENFSIFLFFPALSAKGVHRTKTTLLIQHRI